MKTIEEMTDEELAISYITGDRKAFDLLLLRNQSKLFSYILFVVRDQETANDVFQETFVKVITKLQQGKYLPHGKFGAWLLRIAHNVIMDWFRDKRIENIAEPTKGNDMSYFRDFTLFDDCIEKEYVNAQILSDVKKMMNNLPPAQREVVFMRFYQELSFKEIAEATNVSINTALGRMRYAILNLRRMAKEHHIQLQLA